MLCTAVGGGVSTFLGKGEHYGCVHFNVINVTRGWVGVKFLGKRCYVTLASATYMATWKQVFETVT